MERLRLNLNNLNPLWERKLFNPLHEPKLDSLGRSDVDVLNFSRSQNILGDSCSLAQDIFSAQIIRQSRIKG